MSEQERGGHWEGTKEDFGLVAGFPGDDAIAIAVKDALAWKERLRSADIRVAVHSAEVTLSGWVDSEEQRQLAGAIVERNPTVHNVKNKLRLRRHREHGNAGRS